MDTQTDTLTTSIGRNAAGLAIFAFLTAGIIGIVQYMSAERIAQNIAQAQAKALYEITPQSMTDNDVLNDYIELNDDARNLLTLTLLGPIESEAKIHIARKNESPIAFIFPVVAPDGYTTSISLLVGINIDGKIAGVRTIEHKETPGLGDKIELKKSDWILGFKNHSIKEPELEGWKVKKDGGEFDQFTGATITPRAVVGAVKRALTFFEKHKEQLIQLAADSRTGVAQ